MEPKKTFVTVMLFLVPGEEETYHENESKILSLLSRHGGILVHRLRPSDEKSFVTNDGEPDEVHIVSFDTEEGFRNYINDPERKSYALLQKKAVRKSIVIKGNLLEQF